MRFWMALCVSFASQVAVAERLSIPGANASFVPPQGFTPLSEEEIAVKFPNRNAAKTIVGDERRKTTVAFEAREMALTEEALPELLAVMETSMARGVPGLEWKRREIVEMDGQKWLWLEMTSTALDTDIYNIILMTPRMGKTLVFGFNSTKDLFPVQEAELRKSIESIDLE
jgi:hypothetical protein